LTPLPPGLRNTPQPAHLLWQLGHRAEQSIGLVTPVLRWGSGCTAALALPGARGSGEDGRSPCCPTPACWEAPMLAGHGFHLLKSPALPGVGPALAVWSSRRAWGRLLGDSPCLDEPLPVQAHPSLCAPALRLVLLPLPRHLSPTVVTGEAEEQSHSSQGAAWASSSTGLCCHELQPCSSSAGNRPDQEETIR